MSTVLITGAGSGFGALTARALAGAGHSVYAGMRNTLTKNADRVATAQAYAAEHGVALRTVELDVADQASVDEGVRQVLAAEGTIDVLIHNVGHMTLGPAEAFNPEQVAEIYDTNVVGTQRVNRAVLPHLRERGKGLVVWVSSTSAKGGNPPYLGPYFAAKAAMDSLAATYALELARFGIETSIIMPGSFTTGTRHFETAGHPADSATAQAYARLYAGISEQVSGQLSKLMPPDADAGQVAEAIAKVVDTPFGQRPFRVFIDPLGDGAEEVAEVADRIRTEFMERVGLTDLLHPRQ
jgi:NAD(P)-dependent dehydrogenase (short-subunit alcohol dehydrogenase family)